jgi:dihydropteroate synthase
MARVRHYFSYDEALAEWRRFGLPESFMDRRRMLGNICVIEDDLSPERAQELIKVIKERSGEAQLCRKLKRPKVIIVGPPHFYEQLAMAFGSDSHLLEGIIDAVRNYHQEHTLPVPFGRRELRFDHPLVMGILNLTPDSFSDGGNYSDTEKAVQRAREMVQQGADIIDIGAESTRPGALEVSEAEELKRLMPVLHELTKVCKVPLSIDTRHPGVAEVALKAGANIINDVSGLRNDEMLETLHRFDAPVIAMHMSGEPATMQNDVRYDDLIGDIFSDMENMVRRARTAGIKDDKVILDPGIGFGKNVEQNLEIIRRFREFRSLGRPLMFGASRKSFIGAVTGGSTEQRLEGSLAAAILAVDQGANIVRVHDVAETVKALKMVHAVLSQQNRPF